MRVIRNIAAVLFGIFAIVLSGCAEVDSADLRTSGFYADIQIVVDDSNTQVQARLRTGRALDADKIVLSPGDNLVASMSGESVALNRSDTSVYIGVFNSAAGGEEVSVSLSRINDTDAPDSLVVVPDWLEITAPHYAKTYNAGETITVAWSPANPSSTVSVGFFLNCQVRDSNGLPSGVSFGRGFLVVDDGTRTFAVNDILDVLGIRHRLISGESCPLTVTVKRTTQGVLDRAYGKGGSISASRKKTVVVNLVP